MKILIVGGGGREHALAWKCAQSPRVHQVFVAPGNAGTALEPKVRNVAIPADDIDALLAFAAHEDIALTIVGPEGPLVAGIVDRFAAAGRACFPQAPVELVELFVALEQVHNRTIIRQLGRQKPRSSSPAEVHVGLLARAERHFAAGVDGTGWLEVL